jgi:hypothetical protein
VSEASEAAKSSNPPYTVLGPLESYYPPQIYSESGSPSAFIGPPSAFSGDVQDVLYINSLATLFQPQEVSTDTGEFSTPAPNATYSDDTALSTRVFVNDTKAMIAAITNGSESFEGFGILAPTPESAILFHDTYGFNAGIHMEAFSLITNRIRNSSTTAGTAVMTTTTLRSMRHITDNVIFWNLPITILGK